MKLSPYLDPNGDGAVTRDEFTFFVRAWGGQDDSAATLARALQVQRSHQQLLGSTSIRLRSCSFNPLCHPTPSLLGRSRGSCVSPLLVPTNTEAPTASQSALVLQIKRTLNVVGVAPLDCVDCVDLVD